MNEYSNDGICNDLSNSNSNCCDDIENAWSQPSHQQTEANAFRVSSTEGDHACTAQHSKKKKGWTPLRITALALCCAIIGGIMGVGGSFLGNRILGEPEAAEDSTQMSVMLQGIREKAVIDIAYIDTGEELTAAEVYAANVNSTVGITTSVTTNYWGFQTTSAASGSGFIITSDGYILTNYHVIENSDAITVSLYDGTSYAAKLIGYDQSNDIAVLKVDADNLVPVVLGDSDNINVGDSVIAIGNPLGELTFSLTSGAVSALDREVTLSSSVTMDLIQTDCAINSGNSGGALFNLYGEVIGITNAKYSSSGSSGEASIDNIGFAIPINHVKSIVTSIIENGYIAKPYVGVSVSDVSDEAQQYGLPKGAAVTSVVAGSPAEQGGLKKSDIIISVNGEEITGSSDLVNIVGDSLVGDELNLIIYRQGETVELTIVVGEQVQSALTNEQEQSGQQNQSGKDQQGGYTFPWGFGY